MHHKSQRLLVFARAAVLGGLMASPCSLIADSANVNSIKKDLDRFRAAAKNDLPKDAKKRAQVIKTFDAYGMKLKNIESELMAKVEEIASHPASDVQQEGRAQMARLSGKAEAIVPEEGPAEGRVPSSTEVMKIASAVESVITAPRMEEVKGRVARLEEQHGSITHALAELRKSTAALAKQVEDSRAEQKALSKALADSGAHPRFDAIEAQIAKQGQLSVTLGRTIEALAGKMKAQEEQPINVPAPDISARIASLEAAQNAIRDEAARHAKDLSELKANDIGLAGSQARIESMLSKLVEAGGKPAQPSPAAVAPEPATEQAKTAEPPTATHSVVQQSTPLSPADASLPSVAKLPEPPIQLAASEAEEKAAARAAPVVQQGGIEEKVIVGEAREDPRARAAIDVVKSIADPDRMKDVEEFNDWEEIDFAPIDDPSEMRIAAILPEKAKLFSEPDMESEAVAIVPRGSRLLVEMRRGNWYRVIAPNGRHSWIPGNLLGFGYDEDPESALLIKGVDEKRLEGS